ncbi:MAG: cytochrome c peroxidase [Bacteroidia bacterium]|nr:cytochrome c peroxidase [Bacteroidia bacterium]
MKPTFIRTLLLSSAGAVMVGAVIDLNQLPNYANQPVPSYINKDNTQLHNPITDAGATLGRVLFYDKQLSANQTISCASCHQQAFAFSDTARLSRGLTNGLTGRHSMRLINSRFANEEHFFWDERAATLEEQSTRPIQDHVEMGFSGTEGDPGFDSLIRRMQGIPYYKPLFTKAFGDSVITETRIQRALAQFVRSIQSFDSRYDVGRAQVNNDADPFPNFTLQENQGKALFLAPPGAGGAGCQGCHQAPEFDIDPNSQNNGIITSGQDPTILDLNNTRAPSLRDLFNPGGFLNGPMMHNGNFTSLMNVINHYNAITVDSANPRLDPRLAGPPGSGGQRLNLTQPQKGSLVAFLRTLTGTLVYTDPRWSDPFDSLGNLTVLDGFPTALSDELPPIDLQLYPNPVSDWLNITLASPATAASQIRIQDMRGRTVHTGQLTRGSATAQLDLSLVPSGVYAVTLTLDNRTATRRIVISH